MIVKVNSSYGKQGLPVIELSNGHGSTIRLPVSRAQLTRLKAWLRVEEIERDAARNSGKTKAGDGSV